MLISDIITEAMKEVGADLDDTDLEEKMLTLVKGALRWFPLFCRDELLVATSYATLEAGANYLTTPTGFIREVGEDSVYYIEDGAHKIITKLTDKEFRAVVNTSNTGKPQYYRVISNAIEFDRSADADIDIYIEHFVEVDDVAADDTFFGNTTMVEILKQGVKATYYSDYVEDPAKGREKLDLFKAGLDEIESKHMVSSQGGHIDD